LALTLAAYEGARLALEQTAPEATRSLGGAQAIMDRFPGGMRPNSLGWWSTPLDEETWERIALEQQRPFREGSYEA
jgi:hypothetical protein